MVLRIYYVDFMGYYFECASLLSNLQCKSYGWFLYKMGQSIQEWTK